MAAIWKCVNGKAGCAMLAIVALLVAACGAVDDGPEACDLQAEVAAMRSRTAFVPDEVQHVGVLAVNRDSGVSFAFDLGRDAHGRLWAEGGSDAAVWAGSCDGLAEGDYELRAEGFDGLGRIVAASRVETLRVRREGRVSLRLMLQAVD